MAKKTDHYSFGDDTDDFNWDDGGFDDHSPAESKGRSPIRTLVGSFTSGVAGAAKNTDTQRRFIKEALPDGYVDTYDGALTAAQGIKDVYREAGNELRKVNDETKAAVRKVLPHVRAALPKGIGNRLERYAGQDRSRVEKTDHESAQISFELDSLFKSSNIDQSTKRKLEETPIKTTRDAVEMTESIVSNKLQMNLVDGVNKLVKLANSRTNYFNDIGAKLERKKIELGYRQLFAQNKMLDTLQQTLAYQQSAFKDIIHNTALPDLVKQDQNEVFHDITRRNFYGKVAEPVTNSLSGFIHTMTGKAKEKFKETSSDFTQNLSMGADAIELYFEMKQLEAELADLDMDGSAQLTPEQVSKAERLRYLNQALEAGGSMAGGKFTQWASRKGAAAIKKKWGDNEQVQRIGLAGKNIVNNAGGYGKAMLNDLYGLGPLGKFFEFIGMDAYDMTKSQSNVLQRSNIDGLRQRATYTYKTERTINTVIPGYLAMILNEIRVWRTGDGSLEPVEYDWERDTFSDRGAKRSRILDRVFDDGTIKHARASGRDLMSTLNKGASAELSPKAQEEILKYAFKQASRGELFNLRDLLSYDSGLDPEVDQEVRDWLKNELDISEMDVHLESGNNTALKTLKADAKASLRYQRKRDELTSSFATLANGLPNDFAKALDVTKQEDIQMLRELGLAIETSPGVWEYNVEELNRRLFGADVGPSKPTRPGAPQLPTFNLGGAPSAPDRNEELLKAVKANAEYLKEMSSYSGITNDKLTEIIKLIENGQRDAKRESLRNRTNQRRRDTGPFEPRHRNFYGGGWTGEGGKHELAGFTHKGEVVWSKEDVARGGGVEAVEAMRLGKLQGYASGGISGGRSKKAYRHYSEHLVDSNESTSEKIVKTLIEQFGETHKRIDKSNENLDELIGVVASGIMPMEALKFAGFKGRSWMGKAWNWSKAGVGKAAGWGKDLASMPFKATGAIARGGMNVLGALAGTKDRLVSVGDDIKSKAVDLYIQGSDRVALAAKDIKSRTLIDVNTGLIIEKIGDITGEVKDQAGNIVLRAEDFASGLFTMQPGSTLPKLVAGGIKAVGSGAMKLLGAGRAVASLPFRMLSGARKLLTGAAKVLSRMPDIYVGGEARPRLIASLLNNGGYIVAATGKPVMSIRDLMGEVRNLDGEVVLTHEDLAKGLYDSKGKEIRLFRDKALDAAKKAMMLPINMVSAAGKIALAPLKLMTRGIGGVGGMLTGGKRAVSAVERTNAWLEHIYEILDKRLAKKDKVAGDADGDGDRDGSAIDRLKEAAKLTPEDAEKKAIKEDKEKGGWWSKLLALIGGGFMSIRSGAKNVIQWLRTIAILNGASKAGEAMQGQGGGAGGRRRGGRMAGLGRGLALGATLYGGYSMLNSANAAEDMLSEPMVDPVTGMPTPSADGNEDPSLWDEYGGLATTLGASVAAEGAYGAYRRRRNRQGGIDVDPSDALADGPDSRRDPRGRGRMGRMWDATKRGGRWLGSKFGRRGATQAGGQAARTIAGAAGRQVMWAGIRAGAVAAGSAIAGVLTAPVVIGAAAVAAIGIGGYLAYRYLTKDTNITQNFRMNQYGFKEGDDKRCEALMQLELMLLPHVSVSKDRPASLGRGVNVTQVAELFSVDTADRDQMYKMVTWFNMRFKPIFLGAVTSYYRLTGDKDIHAADKKLTKDQKAKFLSDTHITGGGESNPYMIAGSPFADDDEVKLDYGDITSRYKDAVEEVDDLKDNGSSDAPQSTSKASEPKKSWWQSTRDATAAWWKSTKETVSNSSLGTGWKNFAAANVKLYEGAKELGSSAVESAKEGLSAAGDYATNIINKLSGKQSEVQLSVYKSFLNAGFSKNQAMALTAEVGRENDYNPKFVFGGHTDAAKDKNGRSISNLGFISWNRERRERLVERARAAGVLVGPNNIAQSQAGMDVMAKFVMEEMQGSYRKSMGDFLGNPNIDPESAAAIVGKKYIGWAYGQTSLRGGGSFNWKEHDAKRRGHLNALKKQLGNDTGAAPAEAAPAESKAAGGSGNSGGKAFVPYRNAGAAQASAAGSKTPQIAGDSVQSAVNKATGGSAANTSNRVDMVGSAQVSKLDAKLVEIGKKYTRLVKGVDVSGMNSSFMQLFYAMVGEYYRSTGRGVQVNSAFRSVAKQKGMYDEYLARRRRPPVVAPPGRSRHNSGVAIDINSADANSLNSMGLLKKYRFHRPVKGEAWHLENLAFSKANDTQQVIDKDTKNSASKESSAAKSTVTAKRAAPAPEAAIIKTATPPEGSVRGSLNSDDVTRTLNDNRVSGSSNPVRDMAQSKQAATTAREREQKRADAITTAQDMHLKLIEGTNTRLDAIIALLKESQKAKATEQPNQQPQQPVNMAQGQQMAMNQVRSQPSTVNDPISMKKLLLS